MCFFNETTLNTPFRCKNTVIKTLYQAFTSKVNWLSFADPIRQMMLQTKSCENDIWNVLKICSSDHGLQL